MIAVVLKSFAGQRPGDLVDTTGWRNAEAQRKARQIRGAEASEIALHARGVRNIHEQGDAPAKAGAKSGAKSHAAA